MVSFIIISIVAIIGSAFTGKVTWASIQSGEILDKLFGIQKVSYKYGLKSGLFNEWVHRVTGGCAFCFSFWFSCLTFSIYVPLMILGFKYWIFIDNTIWQWVFNVCWFSVFVNTSTVITTRLIDK